MGDTDKQFNAWLIEEYKRLLDIRELAVKEKATETVKRIDRDISFIKLQLQPLELPDV